MEEHQLWVTELLNRALGRPVAALLAFLHIHPENAAAPIPNHVAMELVVFGVAAIFFLALKRQLAVERPGPVQQCMEILLTNPLGLGVRDMLDGFVGHDGRRYLAMLGSIGIFVLFCNLISLIPTLESPTATASVPLGCAIAVFLYYHWSGLKKHGAGYGKQFLGPVMAVSPLMAIVEVFSHAARLLSLTVRLWVNMMVSELLYGTFLWLTLALFLFAASRNPVWYSLGILPTVVPPLFIVLHIFVGLVQAFVFTILPIIYVAGAVAHEH